MSFSCPQVNLDEMLLIAKRFGYDGIEPRTACGHSHGVECEAGSAARRTIRKKAADSGIAFSCIATSCEYVDQETVRQNLQETRVSIDLAADVGASVIRVFGGRLPAGMNREKATEFLAESLLSVAGHAAERNVTVCVETHDDWSDPTALKEVIKRVNHPAIAVNWDIMHPVRQGGASMEGAFNTLKPWIRHVHFHDGLARLDQLVFKPVGEGDIDHRCAVELLMSAGYDGYLSGEWMDWEPYEIHLPREIAAMKQYEQNAR